MDYGVTLLAPPGKKFDHYNIQYDGKYDRDGNDPHVFSNINAQVQAEEKDNESNHYPQHAATYGQVNVDRP